MVFNYVNLSCKCYLSLYCLKDKLGKNKLKRGRATAKRFIRKLSPGLVGFDSSGGQRVS